MILQKQVIEEIQTTNATNHVWIYDRSGSMYWTLKRLVKDIIAHSHMLRN
jgi:hypothetical protein